MSIRKCRTTAEFEVETEIEVKSGKIGVFGWPRELEDEYPVEPAFTEFCSEAMLWQRSRHRRITTA